MLFKLKLFTLFVVNLCAWTFSERISETKCREYSKIGGNSPSTSIFRVWVKYDQVFNIEKTTIGTLISDQHILSSYRSDLNPKTAFLYSLADDRTYDVDEVFSRAFYNHNNVHLGLVLFKLFAPIEMDYLRRPVCLWTNNLAIPETAAIYVGGGQETKTMIILNESTCSDIIGQPLAKTVYCLRNTELCSVYPTPVGSPIQYWNQTIEVSSSNYVVYGIILIVSKEIEPYTSVVTKVVDHIDWIESNVWPENALCGTRLQAISLISHGENAARGEFPWHAAIKELTIRSNNYICGGTLLNNDAVLTAAHCVTMNGIKRKPNSLKVFLGLEDIHGQSEFESRIRTVIVHSSYNYTHLYNDIAILKLKSMVTYSPYMMPICLPQTTRIFKDDIGLSAGWGLIPDDPDNSNLQKATFPIQTEEDCLESNRDVFAYRKTKTNFCAGWLNGTAACRGDSGGGLVFAVGKQYYIRGIVSTGIEINGKCDPVQLSLFTNVTSFYDWIIDSLNYNSD